MQKCDRHTDHAQIHLSQQAESSMRCRLIKRNLRTKVTLVGEQGSTGARHSRHAHSQAILVHCHTSNASTHYLVKYYYSKTDNKNVSLSFCSAAKRVRCSGPLTTTLLQTEWRQSQWKFWKSANIWRSYDNNVCMYCINCISFVFLGGTGESNE